MDKKTINMELKVSQIEHLKAYCKKTGKSQRFVVGELIESLPRVITK